MCVLREVFKKKKIHYLVWGGNWKIYGQKWPKMLFLGQIKVKKTSDPTFCPILWTHKLVTPKIIGFGQKID